MNPSESHRPGATVPAGPGAERELLESCLAGRPGAWDAFVDRFSGLFSFVAARTAFQRGHGLPAADRDDIVAEMLLECLRNDAAVLRSFGGRSSLSTYLTVIARRVAVRAIMRGVENGRLIPPIPESATTADMASHTEDREQVERLLARLDEAEARLVRLHHLEARSYGEISRLTGMPLGSIGPALSRAREKMRAGDPQ